MKKQKEQIGENWNKLVDKYNGDIDKMLIDFYNETRTQAISEFKEKLKEVVDKHFGRLTARDLKIYINKTAQEIK